MKKKFWMVFAAGLMAAPLLAQEADMLDQTLKIEIKIGTGLANRQPTGIADSFDASTGQLVGWTLIQGAEQPQEISHIWVYQGKEVSVVPLYVKSSYFRTFSKKTVTGLSGSWAFQVKDAAGTVIAEKKFEITGTAPVPAAPAQ